LRTFNQKRFNPFKNQLNLWTYYRGAGQDDIGIYFPFLVIEKMIT